MSSNFLFIKKNWRELYEVASIAENNVIKDPNAALIKIRLYGELLVKHIFKYEGFVERNRMSQKERIDFLLKEEAIPLEVYGMLDSLRLVGNKAVHEASYGTSNESNRLLIIAFHLEGWLTQVYGAWDFGLPVFREPQPLQAVISGNISNTAIRPKKTEPCNRNSISNNSTFALNKM
jgi:type I restriction enzyme, R subunit